MRVNTRKQCVVIALCLMMCGLSSCKKHNDSKPPDTQKQASQSYTPSAQEVKSDQDNPQTSDSKNLELLYPAPKIHGTEKDIKIADLELKPTQPWPTMTVPKEVINVASGKPITSSDETPIIGELSCITDGDKEASEGSYVELGWGKQHVTIDLGAVYEIYAVALWHYHMENRVYMDVIVQVSNEPEFVTEVQTLFNNDRDNSCGLGVGKDLNYIETRFGKLINAKGIKGRYVRLYSQGNTSNDQNHYTEVEVYGKPAK